MIRSSAWFALLACSVARHRCPVSANWMPYSMVSRSRISPIRMTSGAWRRVFFSAACQDSVSTPTSRCVMTQPLCGCTYSTGSSMDTMCPRGIFVSVTDHGGQGGRLTGARPTNHDYQATLVHDHVFQDRRQFQSVQSGYFRRDRPQHGAHQPLLDKGADPEASNTLRCNRKVAFLGRIRIP